MPRKGKGSKQYNSGFYSPVSSEAATPGSGRGHSSTKRMRDYGSGKQYNSAHECGVDEYAATESYGGRKTGKMKSGGRKMRSRSGSINTGGKASY